MTPKINATAWRDVVSRLIKSEMSKRKLRYEDLSNKLADIGISQSSDNLRNKINRGIMGADLFMQIFFVLNIRSLERELIEEIMSSIDE